MLWDEPKIFFLERRYFFSIILSEFLKNRVALHLQEQLLSDMELLKKWLRLDPDLILAKGKNHIFVSKM